jgi:hypothetical protein
MFDTDILPIFSFYFDLSFILLQFYSAFRTIEFTLASWSSIIFKYDSFWYFNILISSLKPIIVLYNSYIYIYLAFKSELAQNFYYSNIYNWFYKNTFYYSITINVYWSYDILCLKSFIVVTNYVFYYCNAEKCAVFSNFSIIRRYKLRFYLFSALL